MTRPLTALRITSSDHLSGGTRQAGYLCQGLRDRGHSVVFRSPGGSAALQHHHTLGGGFPPMVANRGVLFCPEFSPKFRSRRTADVITNSEVVRRVRCQAGAQKEKVHVVYNACVPSAPAAAATAVASLRRELSLEGQRPIGGAVGRVRPEKGFQFLVEAAPTLLREHPSARFVLIGKGTARFLPRLAQLGVADRFRVPGHRSDAARVMGLFDVFAMPSVGMGSCPNVVLEATAAGLSVVGSDVGGVAEIVVEGDTGRVVRPGDPEAFARTVSAVLSDTMAARQMGPRGIERVREPSSLDSKVVGTLAVYGAILGAERGAPGGRP